MPEAGGQASTPRSILRTLLLAVGAPIVAVAAPLTAGAIFPRLPRLGVAGSLVWPTYIGPGVLASLAGTAAAAGATRLGNARLGGALTIAGTVTTLASTVILVDQLRAARAAGAPIRLSTLALRRSPKTSPDETHAYLEDPAGRSLRMDVYRPKVRGTSRAPLMMYVHGGGWYQGAPDDASADLRWFADQGYVVVAPEYSLATEDRPTWDLAMPQIGTALAWAVEHAEQWGADPDRIAVWGASAGANLALATTYAAAVGKLGLREGVQVPRVAAVAGEVPAVDPLSVYQNRDPQWGQATRTMVQTYIGGSIEEYPDRAEAVRVNSYVSPAAPPTLLIASAPDHLVPVAGIRDFVTQAEQAGVDIHAVYRRWGDHLISARFDGLPNQTMLHLFIRHFQAHGA